MDRLYESKFGDKHKIWESSIATYDIYKGIHSFCFHENFQGIQSYSVLKKGIQSYHMPQPCYGSHYISLHLQCNLFVNLYAFLFTSFISTSGTKQEALTINS